MAKKKNKKKMMKEEWICVAAIILAIIGVSFLSGGITGRIIETETELDRFAKCLTENEVKMYGVEWCGYCRNQKTLFEDSFKHVDYIDCDKNKDTCQAEGIKAYPTWEINGQRYTGVQSIEKLSEISGCNL